MANHHLLPRRTSADTDADVSRVLNKLEATSSNLTILRYIANATAQFRPFILFSDAILNRTVLPRNLIEVVVLHVARSLDVGYEWAEHVPMAQTAGVPAEVIDAIREGRLDSVDLDRPTQLAIECADLLLADEVLPEPVWKEALESFGPDGGLELLLIVGWFAGTVRTVIRGLGLESEDRDAGH